MDIHRYNKRTGFIDKTCNVTAENANDEFDFLIAEMAIDPFSTYYRVTLVDRMRQAIVKDSDSVAA